MINTENFTKRLQKVIDYYGETASSFAEKIGVQRSSISHILSGRNKPSLEFVLKIISSYPEVELYWLLNGKGEFPANKNIDEITLAASTPIAKINVDENESIKNKEAVISELKKDKTIERIVIFYSDGSFKNFEN
ncbi:helix-turn-helix domain-containing protein [Mariniflexile jejuense]|uniref:Helix-turn-helix domain-containing protein n=1 Tax=Mariniflexile jejuense TaxID=1173582 RepID=A0ABW3JEY6_9FLAO